jgi:hypothetical protein
MPATVEGLKIHLGLTGARPVDDDALLAAVNAANDWVAAVRPDLPSPDPDASPPIVWPPRADEAATLQAARLYGRRGSVQGIAAFQDAGVTVLGRMDPDVRLLLELGEYQNSEIA